MIAFVALISAVEFAVRAISCGEEDCKRRREVLGFWRGRNEDDDGAAALAYAEAAMDEAAQVVHPSAVSGRDFSGAGAPSPYTAAQQPSFSVYPRFFFFFLFLSVFESQFAVADCWIGKPGVQV